MHAYNVNIDISILRIGMKFQHHWAMIFTYNLLNDAFKHPQIVSHRRWKTAMFSGHGVRCGFCWVESLKRCCWPQNFKQLMHIGSSHDPPNYLNEYVTTEKNSWSSSTRWWTWRQVSWCRHRLPLNGNMGKPEFTSRIQGAIPVFLASLPLPGEVGAVSKKKPTKTDF